MTNDLISRRKLDGMRLVTISIIESAETKPDERTRGWNECIDYIQRNAPTVDAAPVVHGRWIHCAGKSNVWHCSECGGRIMYNQTRKTYNIKKPPVSEANKFCKHCGARMDKEE